MNPDRVQQQLYLRQEILEAGYDGASFQAFCERVQPDAADNIDAWSFDELKRMVEQFKISEKETEEKDIQRSEMRKSILVIPETEEENQFVYEKSESSSSNMPGRSPSMIKAEFQYQKLTGGDNLSQTINCKKIDQNKITDYLKKNPVNHISIKIPQYQKKEEGMFNNSYIVFTILTTGLDWTVNRRYNDFVWLRDILSTQYPGHLVPPLPQKQAMRSFEPLFLSKRMRALEGFLESILGSPQLRNSIYFSDFLEIEKQSDFKIKQKAADKIPAISKLTDHYNLTGEVRIDISKEFQDYSMFFGQYINNSYDVYGRIKNTSQQLFLDFDSASTSLFSLSDNFKQLEKLTENFNQKVPMGQVSDLQSMYSIMNGFTREWGNNFVQQMSIVQENFWQFFRFHQQMNSMLQQFAKTRNEMANNFNSANKQLTEQKAKLFTEQKIEKWELPPNVTNLDEIQNNEILAMPVMLPIETEALTNLGKQFAYYNTQLFEETQRVLQNRQIVYSKRFVDLMQNMAVQVVQMHQLLANTISKLTILLKVSALGLKAQGSSGSGG